MMKQILLAFFVNSTEVWHRKSDRDQAIFTSLSPEREGGGGTPYIMLAYGEAPSERGIFFRPQVYERVGISLVEVYKRVVKSVIWVCERAQKG